MPKMNGCDLAKRIHSLRPDIKVLFVSGYSLEILTLLNLGVDKSQLINKSVDKDSFLFLVNQFLGVRNPELPHPAF